MVVLAAFGSWWSRSGTLLVDRPEWMTAKEQVSQASLAPAAERVLVPSIEPPIDSPISSMAPSESISNSLVAIEQKVTFEAKALMDSSIATGVAEEMITAADAHWRMYQGCLYQNQDDQIVRNMDYLFAAWPEIPRLILEKQVDVTVWAAPNANIQGEGAITYSYLIVEEKFTVAFHTPKWRVKIVFSDPGFQENLWKRIAGQAAMDIKAMDGPSGKK